MIGFISEKLLIPILDFFYGLVPSYGLAIVRALWLRYKITNKRITIDGGWFGKNKTQVSLSNIEEIRSIPRGFGSYGDMVLILNDGSKVEMKSLPLFREKQKFIEDNINKRTQIPNLKEVEGFATKS